MLVLHSTEQMFELVDRVENYSEFLPWYNKTEIIGHSGGELKMRLFMDYICVQQSFATHSHNIPDKEVRMDLLGGPFKISCETWKFIDLGGDMYRIEFKLEYDSSSALSSVVASPVFSHLTGTLTNAFIKEADRRYV